MKFKTLINENKEFIVICTDFKEPFLGSCSTPQLYPITSTLKGISKYLGGLDFEGIKMVEVEINLVN